MNELTKLGFLSLWTLFSLVVMRLAMLLVDFFRGAICYINSQYDWMNMHILLHVSSPCSVVTECIDTNPSDAIAHDPQISKHIDAADRIYQKNHSLVYSNRIFSYSIFVFKSPTLKENISISDSIRFQSLTRLTLTAQTGLHSSYQRVA